MLQGAMLRSTLGAVLFLTTALGCSKKSEAPAGAPPAATAPAPAEPSPAAAAVSGAPKRSSIDCAAILAGSAAHGATYQPGWGAFPAELQVLPPGAELCGSGSPTDNKGIAGVLVRSPMFGAAFDEFYAPLISKMGCTLRPSEIVGSGDRKSTRGAFRCPTGTSGNFGTDTGNEFYYFSVTL